MGHPPAVVHQAGFVGQPAVVLRALQMTAAGEAPHSKGGPDSQESAAGVRHQALGIAEVVAEVVVGVVPVGAAVGAAAAVAVEFPCYEMRSSEQNLLQP